MSELNSIESSAGLRRDQVEKVMREYRSLFDNSGGDDLATRRKHYEIVVNHFYDLVTDFYEFGWGDSFHFAPRKRGERFWASIRRCERTFADRLGLKPGMTALDVGCGVGGPMREVARHSGAKVVGINNNLYQVQKAETYNRKEGLDHLCSVMKTDFMNMPVPDAAYDAAFAIESLPHAPSKHRAYAEIFRVLKPGGLFALHEWCLTSRYDPANPEHVRVKSGIEIGNGLPELAHIPEVISALKDVGFELIEVWDSAADSDPETPWYRGLEGDELRLTSLPRTPPGRAITNVVTRGLEAVHILPKGTTAVSSLLNHAADDLVAGGRAGIFTPLLYAKARRSDRACFDNGYGRRGGSDT